MKFASALFAFLFAFNLFADSESDFEAFENAWSKARPVTIEELNGIQLWDGYAILHFLGEDYQRLRPILAINDRNTAPQGNTEVVFGVFELQEISVPQDRTVGAILSQVESHYREFDFAAPSASLKSLVQKHPTDRSKRVELRKGKNSVGRNCLYFKETRGKSITYGYFDTKIYHDFKRGNEDVFIRPCHQAMLTQRPAPRR